MQVQNLRSVPPWVTRLSSRLSEYDASNESRAGFGSEFIDMVRRQSVPAVAWQHKGAEWRSDRLAALEIEVDSAQFHSSNPLHAVVEAWGCAVVGDGSLPASGFEIKTAPSSGDMLVAQFEQLGTALVLHGARTSSRCGLHCHVDARDLRASDLARLLRLWTHLEDAFFKLIPPARRDNSYCKPAAPDFLAWNRDFPVHTDMVNYLRRRIMRRRSPNISDEYGNGGRHYDNGLDRYKALNLNALSKHQTVEFRLAPGAIRAITLKAWAMLCVSVVDLSVRITEREIAQFFPQQLVLRDNSMGNRVVVPAGSNENGVQRQQRLAQSLVAFGSLLGDAWLWKRIRSMWRRNAGVSFELPVTVTRTPIRRGITVA